MHILLVFGAVLPLFLFIHAGRSGVDVLVSGPPLAGFEGPAPPKKQKHVGVMSAARFLRAQGPLWKKTKRVITDFEAKMG